MKLVLNEEQQMLSDSAKDFAANRTPVNHFRSLRDNNDPLNWDKDVWKEMVDLGWAGILIPQEFGGSDFGLAGISVIMQEVGKTLTPSPLFATAVMGASAINTFGTQEQKAEYLPKIAAGNITTAIAIDEESHHAPFNSIAQAELVGDEWVLNGKKKFVVDGASADILIILARTSGIKGDKAGLTLFIVDASHTGVEIIKTDMADCRNYANVVLDNVTISKDALLGDQESGGEAIDKILDEGRIALSAEMLGNSEAAFEMTLNYLKERKQFGVLIGTFQALQHRAAEMFCEIELTKSAVMAAMQGADENNNDLQRMASLAKSIAGETLYLVSNESVQMHGGIGVTDEYDIGFYMKRARVAEVIFGGANFHQERYANLSNF
ncbi:MAG: acyl-CoA/acyl-ACP dehydrogenase [SAR86 cluster bacterium]|nr:acyl-CoA/acyl-ACP dehydrogenase [SAR86 cluster bacterium]